jgi:hypothetical protein
MSNEMVIELTETSLQFIKLPDTYDEDIREKTFILSKHGWSVHSCASPQVLSPDSLFLPGSSRWQDNKVCHFPRNYDTYFTVLSLLHGVCRKFGYLLIYQKQERTVTL